MRLTYRIARPFLKWAGGKGQILDQIEKYLPQRVKDRKVKKYIEPFLGGGAVFFYLLSKYEFEEIILNDINEEVMLTYSVVQNNVEQLIELLSEMEKEFLNAAGSMRTEIYYNIRNEFNKEKVVVNYENYSDEWLPHAAKMIFLNRTCFNGLYRQNRKGQFNVPIGSYSNPTICDDENLRAVSAALLDVKLLHKDFEGLTDYIDEDTFVYMDPPYRPLSNTSNFSDYSKVPFNDESQVRLSHWYKVLDSKGAALMLSNSDPTNTNPNDRFFDDLYVGTNIRIHRIEAARAINSKASGRGAIRELLIVNDK